MIIKSLVAFGVLTVAALMTMAVLRRRDDGKADGVWQSLDRNRRLQVERKPLIILSH
jgi:hypothetical protein